MELRSVLRRWLKVVFTTCLNRRSSHPRSCVSLRLMRMTALFTLGGGLNTFSPYVLLPGPAAMRSATSFCIMPVQQGIRSLLSSILKKIWLDML